MPRTLDPDLKDCLERANPYTEYRIEISEPDTGQVLRRVDQFTQAPSLISMTPAASLAASPGGGLILAPTTAALQAFAGVGSSFDLNGESLQRRVKGFGWTMDKAFSRATLKNIQAKVERVGLGGFFFNVDFECQIFRVTKTPGIRQTNVGTPQYQSVSWTEYVFTEMLTPAPTLKSSSQTWDGSNRATLTFDLTNFHLTLENSPAQAVALDQVGELPEYLIVVRLAGKPPAGTGHFKWLLDTASSRVIAGKGTFQRVWWARENDQEQWVRTAYADVPNVTINIETYPATGQAVYLIDQGKAPSALSTGRIDFQRSLPPGTKAKLEISTAGSGGPWASVKHGGSLAVRKNLILRSEEFDNAAWVKVNITPTANNIAAPDGTMTADKVAATASASTELRQTVVVGGAAAAPYSIHAKKGSGPTDANRFRLHNISTGTNLIVVALNYDTGVLTYLVGSSGVSVERLEDGWYRITLNPSGVSPGHTVLAYACFFGVETAGEYAYVWGAQIDDGPSATDYIPTTSAAVMFGGAQQTYHLRVTLNADAALRATPQINSAGVEFRVPRDVSVEGVPAFPTREIDMPWPSASIPEGKLRVVRTGSRDYLDVGTALGSAAATSRLEADIFLSSRHPSVTRDKWFRLERMMVTNRLPSATSEEFTLLSYASRLKRKIPQKVETINSVHTVAAGSTTAQVRVAPTQPLPGTTASGSEYDGKNYYVRVRSTAAPNTPPGFLATILGNAGESANGTTRLDFSAGTFTEALVAGDIIEVHSGIFQTQAVTWIDYDPADAWWEVLTSLLAIPTERIGLGSLPRGGKPPKVTDIAPGDATTQAKRKITGRLSEEIEGDKVIDILSAIMGGVTLEIDGQICFVQIIPLLDAAGAVTVPLPPPSAVFDARDFSSPPQTPLGLEKRSTVVTAKYGVPATAASPDSFPSKATTAVDSDALLWLTQQDLEDYGTSEVPDEISKWLYNTTDGGLYLASVIAAQLVRVASTGLRIFPLAMSEKHPTLVPGDVIVVALDSYTDYDPSTQTQIKGPISIRGVLVRVGGEGRQLSMFVPGIRDNAQLVKGGAAGELTGLGVIPAPPVVTASFDPTGQLIINSSGDFATASHKVAWDTGDVTPDIASHGFEDGLLGPYTQYGGVTVVNDPTGLFGGKVTKFPYTLPGAGDDNRAIQLDYARGLGQPMFFKGEFVIPAGSVWGTHGRKLVYFKSRVNYTKYPLAQGGTTGRLVVVLQGADMQVDFTYNPAAGHMSTDGTPVQLTGDHVRTAEYIAWGLNVGQKYTLEIEITRETAFSNVQQPAATANQGTNGKVRIWLDGDLIYEKLNCSFTDAGWVGATGDYSQTWSNPPTQGVVMEAADIVGQYWEVGQQINTAGPLTEDRYWDNVEFSTVRPSGGISIAAARAATPIAGQLVSELATGDTYPAGTTVYVAALAYSANGVESAPFGWVPVTREGSGRSAPPRAILYATDGETDDTFQLLTLDAEAGSGGGGTNLTYSLTQKLGFGNATTLYSGNATALPRNINVARHPRLEKNLRYVTIDLATSLTSVAEWTVPSARPDMDDTGVGLTSGVKQNVAGAQRVLSKGYQSGTTKDNVTTEGVVTFNPVYQNVPRIQLRGGKAANSTYPYDDLAAGSPTPSGFTCRAKNKNKGTTTARTAEFTSSLTTTAVGGTVGPATLANAPAYDNNYTARFKVTAVCTTIAGNVYGSVAVVIAVEVSADSGTNWTEYATRSFQALAVSAGTETVVYDGNQVPVSVSGLDSADKIRLKLKSITHSGGSLASATQTLEGYNYSPTSEGHGVEYTSATGATTESKTPDADDYVQWEAWEETT